jgi:hypothetical protein
MNEREYHDLHYEADGARIQATAIFQRVQIAPPDSSCARRVWA